MRTFKKLLIAVSLAMIAAAPVQRILNDAETSEAMVLAYAVLLPFGFTIVSITGIIAASFADITARFRDTATFRWRPGKVHLAGKNEKKK